VLGEKGEKRKKKPGGKDRGVTADRKTLVSAIRKGKILRLDVSGPENKKDLRAEKDRWKTGEK